MPQLVIIADDTTGAADAGAPYAQAGLVTLFALAPEALPPCDVVVFSTESRHLAAPEASAKVRAVAGHIQNARWVYKKIDSTLRGQPSHELDVLMDAINVDQAVVAPAFPAQRRTVVDGRLHVGSVPLEETAFAHEGASSDVIALLRGASRRPVVSVALSIVRRGAPAVCDALGGPGIAVLDAETNGDLAIVAQAVLVCSIRLSCGSAGLAEALAKTLPLAQEAPPLMAPARSGPAVVVAGSRNPCTLRQVQTAARCGIAVVRPDSRFVAGDVTATVDAIVASLGQGAAAILTTADLADCPQGALALARLLAQAALEAAIVIPLGGLILTGGDIAAAVLGALRAQAIWLKGEMEPGIARGVLLGGLLPGLPVITKAGGFGDDGALVDAIETLTRFPR